VDWGDINRVERIDGGLLGAELEADINAQRYASERSIPVRTGTKVAAHPSPKAG